MEVVKEPQLIIFPNDVEKILALLGLTKDDLIEAIKRGYAARNNATKNDPPGTAGINAYSAIVREIGDSLLPKGWERVINHNLVLTINAETKTAIAVSSGNYNVGIEDAIPRTKNPKGKQYQNITSDNRDIFDVEKKIQKNIFPDFQILILLYFYDYKKGEMRLELSSPIDMDINGYVNGWHKRIIFSPILFDLEPDPKRKQPDSFSDNSQDFDIPVIRRKQ